MQVKNHINNTLATAKRWQRPLNRGGRWIEVSNTAVYRQINRDFGKWMLNGVWPLNRGRTVEANWGTNKVTSHTDAKSGNHNHQHVLMESKTFNHSANLRCWHNLHPENEKWHNLQDRHCMSTRRKTALLIFISLIYLSTCSFASLKVVIQ